MHRKLLHICSALVNGKESVLLHDNTRPHVAQLTLQKLNEFCYETLKHQPYSLKLSPTDLYFFKYLDNFLQEKCFEKEDDVKNASNITHRYITFTYMAFGVHLALTVINIGISVSDCYHTYKYDIAAKFVLW